MAFGKKYDITWSDLRGKVFTAEIHQDGFAGPSTKVKATDTVVELNWKEDGNLLSPVKPSTANLQLYAEIDFEWKEFFVTTVGEYFLRLIQDGNTIWEGLIVDSVYNEPYVDVPYSVNLRFSCGLSELKSIDYLDGSGNFLTGYESLLTIIQRCLNKLPFNLRLKELINVYDDDMLPAHFSLDFDGVNEYLNVPDAANLSFGDSSTDSPFSVRAWVNMDDATNFIIFDKSDSFTNREYTLFVKSTDEFEFVLFDADNPNFIAKVSSNPLTSDEGTWIHLAATYDGSGTVDGIKLYRNGVLLSMTNLTAGSYTAMHNTTSALSIGAAPWVPVFANGKIDESTIINKELSAAEILEDYNSGIIPARAQLSFFASLISVWAMGEGGTFTTEWSIPDEIGSNTATSVNMEVGDRVTDTPADRNLLNSTLADTFVDNLIFIDVDNAGKMEARSCRYVIDRIMEAMGCRIFQSSSDPDTAGAPENVWWIQRVEELSAETESQLDYWEYNSNGTLNNSGRLTSLIKTITNTEAGIKFLNSDAELEIVPAIKTIKYKRKLAYDWKGKRDQKAKKNLIIDENFCFWTQNKEDFTAGGGSVETFVSNKPTYWFLSPAMQALANFNDFNTVVGRDDYIQQLSADGGLRWGTNLIDSYPFTNEALFMEAQFFPVKTNPYGAPTPRSTQELIQINSGDKLMLIYDVNVFALWDIDLIEFIKPIFATLNFRIELEDLNTGDKYFLSAAIGTGNITVKAPSWVKTTIRGFAVNSILEQTRTNYSGNVQSPVFPFTGTAKLTFSIRSPVKYNILLNDGVTPVATITKVDFKKCDLRYIDAKSLLPDLTCPIIEEEPTIIPLEEEVHLQDSDLIRDNDHSLTVIIGDGPDESAVNSFRRKVNTTNFPITDKWTRLNVSPNQDKAARDIFLIDVLKNFLANQKTMLSGTLYGLTDFNFQNIIISDKSIRYIMDGMTWNLKTGEKNVKLLELTVGVGSFVKSVQPFGVAQQITDNPGLSVINFAEGATIDSGTVVIGGSAGTPTPPINTNGQSTNIPNYPP